MASAYETFTSAAAHAYSLADEARADSRLDKRLHDHLVAEAKRHKERGDWYTERARLFAPDAQGEAA